MKTNHDIINVTAFLSALFHIVVILGISFKLPDFKALKNSDNFLDVVLINTPNNEAPENASNISNTNNSGGGNSDLEASSPLPYKAINPSERTSIKRTAQSASTQKTNLALVTTDTSKTNTYDAPTVDNKTDTKKAIDAKDNVNTKAQIQLEKERLIAKINQQHQAYQKRPKKEFLSPNSKKKESAKYIDDWRRKVEDVGNASYPPQARQKNLFGLVAITVEINRNGSIHSLRIDKPSKHKILNDAALKFVRDAAPYGAFPDEIDPSTSILVISRVFKFHAENRLSSSNDK